MSILEEIKKDLLVNQFILDFIEDSQDRLEFILIGYTKNAEKTPTTFDLVKSIRRYLHLNYNTSVLVFQHGIAFNEKANSDPTQPNVTNPLEAIEDPEAAEKALPDDTTLEARFVIQKREALYEFKTGEYNNLLLVPNPTYEKVSPKLVHNVVDRYDNVDDETIDNSFDIDEEIQKNSNICITGVLIDKQTQKKLFTREQAKQVIEDLGMNYNDSVLEETDLVVIGESFGVNKIKVAKKKNKRLVSAESFISELKRKGVAVAVEE
jgi:hypothetical protein